MRAPHRLWAVLIAPAFAALFLAGCFESAKPSELSCTGNQYCPGGYACVGARPGTAGSCQKPKDAAAEDAPDRSADVADSDGLDEEDGALDHGDLAATQDSLALAKDAPVSDQAIEVLVGADAAPDRQLPGDLGSERFSDAP